MPNRLGKRAVLRTLAAIRLAFVLALGLKGLAGLGGAAGVASGAWGLSPAPARACTPWPTLR